MFETPLESPESAAVMAAIREPVADARDERSFLETVADTVRELAENIREAIGITEAKEVSESLELRAEKALESVFDAQTVSEWSEMSIEERSAKLSDYYAALGESLGIDTKGVIVEDLWSQFGEGTQGYNSGDGYVHIDVRQVADSGSLKDLLDTTTHEARHQLQAEALEDPSRFPEISPVTSEAWEMNFRNYLSFNDVGFEYYSIQAIEVDARQFAESVLDQYAARSGISL
jgi:hypothetical protein